MAGRLRARGVAIVLAAGAAVVGLLGGVAVTPAAAQPTVLTVPTVTGVSPTSGPVIGGTVVTITGNFFTSPVTVNFGANASTNVTLVNSTTLKATSPPVTATAKVDITVTTAGGTSLTSAADQFTYTGPTVTGVSPASGPAAGGTVVTIFGTGFTTGSTVTFGGTAATPVTFVSSTVLKVPSPGGSGAVDVQVTTSPYTSKANPPLDTFTYNSLPTVNGVAPATGPITGGTVVTITGTGFTTGSTVAFGTVGAGTNVQFVSSTALKATSPVATATGAVDVHVTTSGNTSKANPPADTFTYTGPTVTSVSPASGPNTGGTVVTISGSGFTNTSTVTFGTTNPGTNVTFLSSTALKATSPAGTGTVNIFVTTNGVTSAMNGLDKYTYTTPGPTVTSVSPASGPNTGGTVVTISGTGFTNTSTVAFGTVGAGTNVTFLSSTALKATSPSTTGTSTVNILVTTNGITSTANTLDRYTYTPPGAPAVTSVSPTSGPIAGGTVVTITGTGFTGVTAVNFGANAATNVTPVSATVVKATSPAVTAPSTVDVQVTTPIGTSVKTTADQFTYKSGPTVTSVSPASGPNTGGTVVTISGTGFTNTSTVAFGTVGAGTNVTFLSSTALKATSPSTTGTSTVNILVTTNGITSTANTLDRYTYTPPGAPAVTSVSPTSGPIAGGTVVTIVGTGFTGVTAVNFGANAATNVTPVSATVVKATSPAVTTPSTVDVQVTTPIGTSVKTTADKFTYGGPTVTGVSPASGPVAGGTVVTITGTGFTGVTAVNFGTTAATNVKMVSSTIVKATSPATTLAGKVHVTVIATGGTSPTTTADQFNYRAEPTVLGVSPASGPTAGGTVVTINGTGFTTAATVSFGGTAAAAVTFVSTTVLKATSPAVTTAGTIQITVTTTGGTSAFTTADQYTYL